MKMIGDDDNRLLIFYRTVSFSEESLKIIAT